MDGSYGSIRKLFYEDDDAVGQLVDYGASLQETDVSCML